MTILQEIATLDPKAQELLEASGYFNIDSLKEHTLSHITEEIVKANKVLGVVDEELNIAQVRDWLLPLQDELGGLLETSIAHGNLVSERELLSASFAIPLSKQFIEKNDVDIDQLLTGRVRFVSEDDALAQSVMTDVAVKSKVEPATAQSDTKEASVNEEVEQVVEPVESAQQQLTDELAKPVDDAPQLHAEQNVVVNDQDADIVDELLKDLFSEKVEAGINKKRILTMDTFRAQGGRVEPLKSAAVDDLTRSARKETNAGKDPSSRRFVRGVLHKGVASFMGSLFAYLLFVFCMVGGVFLPILAVIDKEKFFWAVYTPALLLIGVIFFFMFTGKASCPICNQKQFRPKRCLKHRNAHRFPLLGYMLPTALHALFFKWFRCIFCGTSVRLKE